MGQRPGRAREATLPSRAGALPEGGARRGRGCGSDEPRRREVRPGVARLHGDPSALRRSRHREARLRGRSGLAVRLLAVRRRLGRGDRDAGGVFVALRGSGRQRSKPVEARAEAAGRDHARRRAGQDLPRLSEADRAGGRPAEGDGASEGRVLRRGRQDPSRSIGARLVHGGADPGKDRPHARSVPKPAIRTVDGRTGVFRIVDGRARFQPVKAGAETQGQVEIVEGLSGGERLVSSSSGEIRDGDRVRVEGEKS